MPGWYQDYENVSGVQIVGLIQEQHPERCALFMEWKQMDFPILVDSLNRIGVYAVPLMWAIDEHGVVQKTRPQDAWIRGEFLSTDYPKPGAKGLVEKPSNGVKKFLAGDFDAAVAAFEKSIAKDGESGERRFRLGCALRARHDSTAAQADDFQGAISAWTRALELNPRNYIFRRRIEQYGPRLMKPYPFYTWVAEARTAIAARGDEVPALRVALEGSEVALPQPRGGGAVEAAAESTEEPDLDNAIPGDENELIRFDSVVAPAPAEIGQNARVYLRFAPDEKQKVTWDNEAGPLEVWIHSVDGFVPSEQLLTSAPPTAASSSEARSLELEIAIPASATAGKVYLEGYALYYVCTGDTGECTYLRQDFAVPLELKQGQQRRRRRR